MITVQKHWFHATTKENWEKIQQTGVLWGGQNLFLACNLKQLIDKCTGASRNPLDGDMLRNQLVLSVRYTPNNIDDSFENGWELIVKKPIPLENVRLLRYI